MSPKKPFAAPRRTDKTELPTDGAELRLCFIENPGILKNCIENIREILLWKKTAAKSVKSYPSLEEKNRGKHFRFSLIASIVSHVTVMALIISITISARQKQTVKNAAEITMISPGKIFYPVTQKKEIGGGGGGGEQKQKPPPRGKLPKKSERVQLAPPSVAEKKEPELPVPPSIVVPPEIMTEPPEIARLGDPSAELLQEPFADSETPSNGPGDEGGIGSGSSGGVGSGEGPGLGPGEGGGTGGGIYKVGNGVSAPRCLLPQDVNCPRPDYPDKGRKEKVQGTVILDIVVDEGGIPKNISVRKSISPELDEAAIKAVEKWRFAPARKNGEPVPVYATVEVVFRLL